MPDIFNRTTDSFGGSFAADQAQVTFPALAGGGSDAGLLLQNLQFSYSQNVTRLYELGSPMIYYVGGRTQGNMGAARVVGPRLLSAAFYSTYGDVCNAPTNLLHFSLQGSCHGTIDQTQLAMIAYTARYVVITAVGVSVAANDVLINESIQGMFSSLSYG